MVVQAECGADNVVEFLPLREVTSIAILLSMLV